MILLSSSDFSKLTFSENSFRNTIRVSNGSVSPNLGPNWFHRLISAENKSRPLQGKSQYNDLKLYWWIDLIVDNSSAKEQ